MPLLFADGEVSGLIGAFSQVSPGVADMLSQWQNLKNGGSEQTFKDYIDDLPNDFVKDFWGIISPEADQ